MRRLPPKAAAYLSARRTPTLTVVLPVYDVEDYLAECLDSVLGQSLRDLEVVAVDDGSRDGSAALLAAYAARDPRLRVVRQANAGLGAARNAGVRLARGTYLTFVDSDDRLPAGALAALVGTLRRTGSDLAVGAVRRFTTARTWPPDWVQALHAEDRLGTTLEAFPALLRNNYTWNKVFTREFWDRCGLEFREGVAYEDQPVVTQLLLRARSLDVLSATVYEYRVREDRSSISQQTDSLPDLRDRVLAWQVSRDVLLREAPQHVFDAWLQTLFSTHFHWYLDNAAVEDPEYWKVLSEAVRDLTQDAPAQVWRRTPPARRVAVELARRGLHEELVELRRQGGGRAEAWPAQVRPDGLLVQLPLPGARTLGLEDELFLLHPEQLSVRCALHRVAWLPDAVGPGRALHLAGHAYLPHLDLREHHTDIVLALVDRGTGERLPLSVQRVDDPVLRPAGTSQHADVSTSTFSAQIDLDALVRAGRRSLSLEVAVTTAGFTASGPVTELSRRGSPALLETAAHPDGWHVSLDSPVGRPLRVRVDPRRAEVTAVRLEGRRLTAKVRPLPGRPLSGVLVEGAPSDVRGTAGPLQPDGTQEIVVHVPPPPAAAPGTGPAPTRWGVRGLVPGGGSEPLALPTEPALRDVQEADGAVLALERTRRGNLGLVSWPGLVRVEAVEVAPAGTLRVAGRVCGERPGLSLRLRGVAARTADVPVVRDGERFSVEIPLTAPRGRFGELPLPARTYTLEAGGGHTEDTAVVLDRTLVRALPVAVVTDRLEGRLLRGGRDRLDLALLSPRGEQARSLAAQAELQRWSATLLPERWEGLLVRSYFGESATDNGLGVLAELRRRGADLPVRWAVKDHSVPLPEGVTPVVHGSREWYRLLGTSRYYLDNMFQPRHHAKPAGQVLVQTFHGYPFKSMGHTYWERAGFARDLVASYDARARQWDHLVSPARYATALLRREFRYEGDVLEIGYPRNDVLLSAEAGDLRAAVRASLGIADTQTAVLYAPTFRDDQARDNHRAAHQDLLGLEALAVELGPEFVVLHRGHAFHARTGDRTGNRGTLLDVTDYPEVSDLYLAADVAVVDYSSLRFDFGVTGKPMVFFVPDLERYQHMRGWLVDYEPTAPGPHLSERGQVVQALQDLDGLRHRYAQAYRRFREDFLSLEDGHAGARFVDAVFVPRGDAPPATG